MATTKTLTVYESKDGARFDTEKDADQHDAENDFVEWYEGGQDVDLWGSTGQSRVDALDLVCWLRMNRDKVMELYQDFIDENYKIR